MKGIRDIKRRIKSVKNTAQITRAMQLVAASKMKRAQDKALAGRPYSLLLAEILNALITQGKGRLKHPFMEERTIAKRGILVIATDKGLCGPLNSNLFRQAIDIDDAAFICIGKKSTQFLSRAGRNVIADFSVSDHTNFNEVRVAVEFMINAYLKGEIDSLEVLFSRFINTLKQEPVIEQLLPFSSLDATLESLRKRLQMQESEQLEDAREMLFEPDPQAILSELPSLFIKQEIYQMVLEAKASEHSARMVAMKSATDNAKSLVDDLTLQYNKARQAAITQEILEIAASTAARNLLLVSHPQGAVPQVVHCI